MDTQRNDLQRRAREAGFPPELCEREDFLRLVRLVERLGSVCVAYSGGVDSTFLLRVAQGVLGERAVGVLATSESLDQNELAEALRVASEAKLRVEVIEAHEYDNPAYRRNDQRRCFHCKNELFLRLREFASEHGFAAIADGSNADDVGDFRPGLEARDRHEVSSPLLEAGLSKAVIRSWSRQLGLPTWDKPAAPCLASRIPYGTEVTVARLRQVEAAEKGLRDLGLRTVRVRHHGDVARVEIPLEDLRRVLQGPATDTEDPLAAIAARVKGAGFLYVTLDVEGFRSGSLNAALPGG